MLMGRQDRENAGGSSGYVSKEKVDEEAKHKVPGEIKRREVELDLKLAQKRS